MAYKKTQDDRAKRLLWASRLKPRELMSQVAGARLTFLEELNLFRSTTKGLQERWDRTHDPDGLPWSQVESLAARLEKTGEELGVLEEALIAKFTNAPVEVDTRKLSLVIHKQKN